MPNIIGLGLDATDIDRIAGTIERYGDRFLRRVFTEEEIAYAMRRPRGMRQILGDCKRR